MSKKKKNNVYEMGIESHPNMNVTQALDAARKAEMQDALIIGWDKQGSFCLRGSRMTKASALWLVKQLEIHILDL